MAGSSVSIVAHEDDDLLFQNPDIADWIGTGLPHATIYVTAGEYNGQPTGGDRGLYAAWRQDGERAAYAQMAGVTNDWDRTVQTFNGHDIEVDTLTAAPSVNLVFLGLPDGGDADHPVAVANLLSGAIPSVTTIVATGSPVAASTTYDTATDLILTLHALLTTFNATVVRAQDPAPNPHYGGDHADHIAVANFVDRVLTGYHGPNGSGNVVLINYRCYNIADSQPNIAIGPSFAKAATFNTYQAHDPLAGANNWTIAQYYRWPPGTAWLGYGPRAGLEAFAVRDGGVQHWYQQAAGESPWTGSEQLGGGSLSPNLAIASRTDGCLALFGLQKDTHELIYAYQTPPTHQFSGWSSLGNPDGAPGIYPSPPTLSSNADGRLEVFVRNTNGGLSTIYETVGGGWSNWVDLGGGPDLDDDAVATVKNTDGRIEIFAATGTGVEHWYQGSPNGGIGYDPSFPLSQAPLAGPPTAGVDPQGLLHVFYRAPRSGEVCSLSQTALNNGWQSTPQTLGGPSGQGEPVAMSTVAGVLGVASRTDGGGLSFEANNGTWVDLQCEMLEYPAVALSSAGVPTLATLGLDGSLYINTQQPDGSWTGWSNVGT